MPRHLERWAVLGLTLAIAATAQAQDSSPSGPRSRSRNSLADRLGHLGRNLVGATDPAPQPETAPPREMPTDYRQAGPPAERTGDAPPTGGASSRRPGSTRSSRRTAQPQYQSEAESTEAEASDSAAPPVRRPPNTLPPEERPSLRRNPTTASRPAGEGSSSRRDLSERMATRINRTARPPAELPEEPPADESSADSAAVETDPPAEAAPAEPEASETPESVADEAESSDSPAAGPARRPAEVARSAEPRPFSRPTQSGPAMGGSADSEGDVLVTQQSPVILVSTAGPRKIRVGVAAKYQVQVQNAGTAPADELVLNLRLPEWAEVARLSASSGEALRPGQGEAADAVEWTIHQLPEKGRAELTLDIVPRKSRPLDLNVEWTHAPVAALAHVEVQEAKLVMTISGPEEVQFGDREMYKLTLSNPGTGDAEDVVVRLLPTSPGDTETATHRIGTIAAGHTKVVELELMARDPGHLVISAEATADGGLQAAATTEILVRRAELAVDLAGPRKQFAGSVATYKIRVANAGNAVAQNVLLTAVAPPGGKFVAASEGGRIEAEGSKIVWRLATLRPETEQLLAFRCRLETPGPNRPQIVCLADDDLKDTAAITTEVEALADLVLTVRDPSGPVPVGEDAEYEIRVLNRGKKAAEGVEFVAFFSDGIEPLDATGARYQMAPGQVIFEQLPLVDAGQEVVLVVRARATAGGDHVFRAQVRCQSLNTTLAGEETTHFYDVTFDEGEAGETSSFDAADATSEAEAAGDYSADAEAAPGELLETADELNPEPTDELGSSEEPAEEPAFEDSSTEATDDVSLGSP